MPGEELGGAGPVVMGGLPTRRRVVRVAGPDAGRYLQGQLSQDLDALEPGHCTWSLVLQPQGKLDALVRVTRLADEELLLDTDAVAVGHLVERLGRFKLRTRAEITELDWGSAALRAPLGAPVPDRPDGPTAPAASDADGNLVLPFAWGGWWGYDVLGPGAPLPAATAPLADVDFELGRVLSGFPCHGSELDEATLPAEAGLVGRAVSFTKVCYTGQELVARIDSRGGHVPRHLRGLALSAPAPSGAVLRRPGAAGAGERPVGRVTSTAGGPVPGWWALAYCARSVEVGDEVEVVEAGPQGSVEGAAVALAVVHELPCGRLAGMPG